MKRSCQATIILLIFIFCPHWIFTQVQYAFNYQGVAQEASGEVISNPVNDLLQINGINSELNYSFTLYNSLVSQIQKVVNQHNVNFNALSEGLYFIKVEMDNSSKIYKIIKT